MKKGHLLIGGAYFTDERLEFFDHPLHEENKDRFMMQTIHWEDVVNGRDIHLEESDFIFIFGMKTWTRKMRKRRMKAREVASKLARFLKININPKTPLGMLDDLNACDEDPYGEGLRDMAFGEFNCKTFLLREYLTNRSYDPRVHPFSICCLDYTEFAKDNADKKNDIYFWGDNSSDDRNKILSKVDRFDGLTKELKVYKGGERSPDKLPRDEFLKKMADAKICLCFSGHGYCTFRFQETASVGSIIAQPRYPFVVRNDYVDMESCIRYDKADELEEKVRHLLSHPDELDAMRQKSMDNFLANHTTQARYKQFLEHVKEDLCDGE